jgi:hypothetical protein
MESHLSHSAAGTTLGFISVPSRHTFLQERFEVLSSAELLKIEFLRNSSA